MACPSPHFPLKFRNADVAQARHQVPRHGRSLAVGQEEVVVHAVISLAVGITLARQHKIPTVAIASASSS